MNKVIVFGAGVSGKGASKLLNKLGKEVILVDDKVGIKSEEALQIIQDIELFVKSPGIPSSHFLIKEAVKNGVEVIDETELAYRNSNYKIIAVTGTNGKTTTTTKINEILKVAGYKSEFAGNIGRSFSELVSDKPDLDFIVLELSSYQLEEIKKFKPYISMIINLSPDHLNRYKTLNDYYLSKFSILKNQDKNDYTLINIDDEEIVKISKKLEINATKIFLTKSSLNQDIYINNNKLYYNNNYILDIKKLSLKGVHNLENILFVVATAMIIGIDSKTIREFLYNTKGLEHRMEHFYTYKKTEVYNDSKGTNLDSTIKALNSFEGKITLICGGKDKKLDLKPLSKLIKNKVDKLYLIGETSDVLENLILEEGFDKECIFNLKEIDLVVDKLTKDLDFEKKNIILFSPAASSFDQFENFEERGRIFKELIKKNFILED